MLRMAIGLLAALSASQLHAINLTFDDAPFPAGARAQSQYSQGDFHLSGHFSHTGGSNSGRPVNGSGGFISALSGDQIKIIQSTGPFFVRDPTGELIPVEPPKIPFHAISVDLAEYSIVFPFPADVTFFGLTVSGQQVSHTFTVDGVIQSLGGTNDFESFNFPASFRNLLSLTTHKPQAGDPDLRPFAFDNLRVVTVPEPSSVIVAGLFIVGLIFRSSRPR